MKSGIKNGTEITLNLLSNVVGNSSDKTNFPHKLLLTNKQVSKIRKAFTNDSSANIKFSKTQLSKMVQLSGFLPAFFDSLPNVMTDIISGKTTLMELIKNNKDISKSEKEKAKFLLNAGLNIFGKVLHKKLSSITGSGITLQNNEIKDIIKVIRYLENRGILLKRTTKKITTRKGFSIFLDY